LRRFHIRDGHHTMVHLSGRRARPYNLAVSAVQRHPPPRRRGRSARRPALSASAQSALSCGSGVWSGLDAPGSSHLTIRTRACRGGRRRSDFQISDLHLHCSSAASVNQVLARAGPGQARPDRHDGRHVRRSGPRITLTQWDRYSPRSGLRWGSTPSRATRILLRHPAQPGLSAPVPASHPARRGRSGDHYLTLVRRRRPAAAVRPRGPDARRPGPAADDQRPRRSLLKHQPRIDPRAVGDSTCKLSGHTHAGQIFPFNYLLRLQYPLIKGYTTFGHGSKLYISRDRDLGPPMRRSPRRGDGDHARPRT